MAFARSLHTFNCSKKMNCNYHAKAVYLSIATKVLVSPVSCPSKKKPQTKNKRNQANKKHTNTTKPKQTKTQRSGIATSYGNNMHDDILCGIMRMATEIEAKQRKHRIYTIY